MHSLWNAILTMNHNLRKIQIRKFYSVKDVNHIIIFEQKFLFTLILCNP